MKKRKTKKAVNKKRTAKKRKPEKITKKRTVKNTVKSEKKKKKKSSDKGYTLGSLDDEDSIEESKKSMESGGGGDPRYIKFEVGNNYVYLISKKFLGSYLHIFKADGKTIVHECLGGKKGKGFAPQLCPTCAEAAGYYKKKKDTKDKEEQKRLNELGNNLHAKFNVFLHAVKGFAVKEKIKGELKSTIGFEKKCEGQILRLSESQWQQIVGREETDKREGVAPIHERFSFLKKISDIFGRGLVFKKKSGRFGKVTVKALKPIVSAPKITNDLEDLENEIPEMSIDEIKEAIDDFKEDVYQEDDIEEDDIEEEEEDIDDDEEEEEGDDDDDIEEDDDEDDDEEEEEKPKKRKKKNKKKKRSKVEEIDDDEEDEDDDDEDDDIDF